MASRRSAALAAASFRCLGVGPGASENAGMVAVFELICGEEVSTSWRWEIRTFWALGRYQEQRRQATEAIVVVCCRFLDESTEASG